MILKLKNTLERNAKFPIVQVRECHNHLLFPQGKYLSLNVVSLEQDGDFCS